MPYAWPALQRQSLNLHGASTCPAKSADGSPIWIGVIVDPRAHPQDDAAKYEYNNDEYNQTFPTWPAAHLCSASNQQNALLAAMRETVLFKAFPPKTVPTCALSGSERE
jgi:hypothetical protein